MGSFEKNNRHKKGFASLSGAQNKGWLDLIKWKWSHSSKPWPFREKNPVSPLEKTSPPDQTSATWITHSTVLLRTGGFNILTDPVFSDVIGPFSFLGIQRRTPPAYTLENLPPIDIVLISHNHYDHLDAPSMKSLARLYDPLIIAPLGNGSLLESLGCTQVVELDWWENYEFNSVLHIELVPALHWSRRSLWDTCQSLWGGFVIRHAPRKIFFAGDSGYHCHFKEIYEKHGAMDLSLLPIGAYEPRWFMKEAHMNPADAVQAHQDLHSKLSMGIHFGTFPLTDEGIDDPVHDLKIALEQAGLNPLYFIAPQLGQTVVI